MNEYRQPMVEFAVRGPTGRSERVEFIVDTGFDGELTLHSAVVAELQLPSIGVARAILADGRETVFQVCEASVVWDNAHRTVVVDVSDTVALVGTALLAGSALWLEMIPGGAVQITPLSAAA